MSSLLTEKSFKKRKFEGGRKKFGGKRKKTAEEQLEAEWNIGKSQPTPAEIDSDECGEDEGTIKKKKLEDLLSDDSDEETAQEKRVRLQKELIEAVIKEEQRRTGMLEVSQDAINQKLRDDILEEKGKKKRLLAETITGVETESIKLLRGHKNVVTCHVISSDDKYIYSGSKDCSIIKWSLETFKKCKMISGGRNGQKDHVGHTAHILALAISTDGTFLASGCANGIIHIWNAETMELLKTFTDHKGAIRGLAFQKKQHTLFSCSSDLTVRHWNLDEMATIDYMVGSKEPFTSMDGSYYERVLTSSEEGKNFLFKILEGKTTIYKRGEAKLGVTECIRFASDSIFITGEADGNIHVWRVTKGKPIHSRQFAHGQNKDNETAHWVTSVAALFNSDLAASGSMNGQIKLWRFTPTFDKMELVCDIPVEGFVNCLQFTSDGKKLVASIGREHRLGRWWNLEKAKNGIMIIDLQISDQTENGESESGESEDDDVSERDDVESD